MKDPHVKAVAKLLDEYSVPEILEGLVVLSRYWERRMKAENNREWVGWVVVRKELEPALKKLDA